MAHRTAPSPAATEQDQRPLDVATMRAAACRLLTEAAEPPSPEELDTLTLQLRGHIMLAIPEVEAAMRRLPDDAVPRACALACIGEAHMRLNLDPGRGLHAGIAHAERLARSVNALCDHHENLNAATT